MKNKFIKNKKGSDKVISIYWFAVIVLIAGGVFGMVYSFYNSPYDVREIEGNILADKIADCVSFQGKVSGEIISDGEFNPEFENIFLGKCNLNFKSESENGWENEIQYFAEVGFYNVTNKEVSSFTIVGGNENLRADCFIKKESGRDYKKFTKCTEKRIYSLDDEGKQHLIKILVGVRKAEENVKL